MDLFAQGARIPVRALCIGERINVREFGDQTARARGPQLVRAGKDGWVAIFRYGSVVFFNLAPDEQSAWLNEYRDKVVDPYIHPTDEETFIEIVPPSDEPVRDGTIRLPIDDAAHLQVVAEILAKSVVLDHYESAIASVFARVEHLAELLEARPSAVVSSDHVLRHIGRTLRIHQKVDWRVEVLEKPEILWDRADLERLYVRLEYEYELRERNTVLARKLELILRTSETIFGLSYHRRSLRVEWYIVVLILADIVIGVAKYLHDLVGR